MPVSSQALAVAFRSVPAAFDRYSPPGRSRRRGRESTRMARNRQRDRPGKRRRRTRRRSALGILLGLIAATALLQFLRSDVFRIGEVTVSGTEVLTAEEVRRLTGLDRARLVWEVWPWRLEGRLLGHPRVGAADVSIRWPNRVRVTVEERRPVVYLLQGRSAYVEVDADGRVLGVVGTPRAGGEPLVTGLDLPPLRAGERPGHPLLRRAVAVAAALGPAGRARMSEIHLSPAGEVILYTLEGVPIFLGIEDRWEPKILALQGILESLADPRQVAYVDLRSALRPVVKMRDAAAAVPPPEPPPPPNEVLP